MTAGDLRKDAATPKLDEAVQTRSTMGQVEVQTLRVITMKIRAGMRRQSIRIR